MILVPMALDRFLPVDTADKKYLRTCRVVSIRVPHFSQQKKEKLLSKHTPGMSHLHLSLSKGKIQGNS